MTLQIHACLETFVSGKKTTAQIDKNRVRVSVLMF